MKKFKTRKKYTTIKNIIIVLVLVILFTLLSFIKLTKSNNELISLLLNKFSNKEISLNIITSNLDNLIYTPQFIDNKNILNKRKTILEDVYNSTDNIISLIYDIAGD